jgi:hypothetical protein
MKLGELKIAIFCQFVDWRKNEKKIDEKRNKCSNLTRPFPISSMMTWESTLECSFFAGKVRSLPKPLGSIKVLQCLFATITLAWKILSRTNTLAYFAAAWVTEKKSFSSSTVRRKSVTLKSWSIIRKQNVDDRTSHHRCLN